MTFKVVSFAPRLVSVRLNLLIRSINYQQSIVPNVTRHLQAWQVWRMLCSYKPVRSGTTNRKCSIIFVTDFTDYACARMCVATKNVGQNVQLVIINTEAWLASSRNVCARTQIFAVHDISGLSGCGSGRVRACQTRKDPARPVGGKFR